MKAYELSEHDNQYLDQLLTEIPRFSKADHNSIKEDPFITDILNYISFIF